MGFFYPVSVVPVAPSKIKGLGRLRVMSVKIMYQLALINPLYPYLVLKIFFPRSKNMFLVS